jgi:hypothetical protein
LDFANNFDRLTVQGMKRIGDNRVKSQIPGIMTLLPMKAAVIGHASPA